MQKIENTGLCCYMDGLYRYAMVLTRNPAEAADLVQETYVRALAAQANLRPDSNEKGWIFTILRNIWINQLRRGKIAPEIADFNLDECVPASSTDAPRDPYSLYVSEIERTRVRQALAQLPAEARDILVLREYEDLSYQEIADILGCPLGTVMSRLARARGKLRSLLSDL